MAKHTENRHTKAARRKLLPDEQKALEYAIQLVADGARSLATTMEEERISVDRDGRSNQVSKKLMEKLLMLLEGAALQPSVDEVYRTVRAAYGSTGCASVLYELGYTLGGVLAGIAELPGAPPPAHFAADLRKLADQLSPPDIDRRSLPE